MVRVWVKVRVKVGLVLGLGFGIPGVHIPPPDSVVSLLPKSAHFFF